MTGAFPMWGAASAVHSPVASSGLCFCSAVTTANASAVVVAAPTMAAPRARAASGSRLL